MKNTSLLSSYQAIPVNAIVPSPYQARKEFDAESLAGLAASMKQEGLIEPIVVRPGKGGKYELISGERRLRAAKLLGWETIETKIIATKSEGEAAIKGLIENLQRQDLNPIEEAEGIRELKAFGQYKTQTQLAKAVCKNQGYISRSLALLDLCETALKFMRQRIISREHGIELLRILDKNLQKSMTHKVEQKGWSVKETRLQIELLLKGESPVRASSKLSTELPPADPLAKVWERLHAKENFVPDVGWSVAYKDHGAKAEPVRQEWVFSVRPSAKNSENALRFWFEQMAVALKGGKTKAAKSEGITEIENIHAAMKNLTPVVGAKRPPRNEQEYMEWLRKNGSL